MWPPACFWFDALLDKGSTSLRQRLVAAVQAFLQFFLPLASLPGSSVIRQPLLHCRSLKRASTGDSPGEFLPLCAELRRQLMLTEAPRTFRAVCAPTSAPRTCRPMCSLARQQLKPVEKRYAHQCAMRTNRAVVHADQRLAHLSAYARLHADSQTCR